VSYVHMFCAAGTPADTAAAPYIKRPWSGVYRWVSVGVGVVLCQCRCRCGAGQCVRRCGAVSVCVGVVLCQCV